MHLLAPYLFLYAFLACAGGVVGFVKAQSKASLIAGIASGALLGLAGALVVLGHVGAGAGLALAIAVALLGRFAPAFIKTKKVMPAGLMVVLGVVAVALSVWTLSA
jgi:uncharacterized membrane protein (UPF0136 family)